MANGIDFGTAIGLIKGLGSPDPAVIESAVSDWLDDHPEATTTVQDGSITKAKLDSNLQGTVDDVADLKSQTDAMSTATATDVGKALSPKTVTDGKVTEWKFVSAGGGGGGGAVDDVQVNGVSVVTDGVANVPIASNFGVAGVVKVNNYQGFKFNSDGSLAIDAPPSDYYIKQGVAGKAFVVAVNQHFAVFYGLAKAAGDTTQSVSTNALGNYTDAAKSAIQVMLGIAGIIGNVEGTTASQAYSVGDAFLHGGALYKATASIAANDAIVPGTNCEQTTLIDLMKGA